MRFTPVINIMTTNAAKFRIYQHQLGRLRVKLKQIPQELNEIQSLDMRTLIRHKLADAKKLLPGEKVIVDDRGFCIPALNNFPGPFMKTTIEAIGAAGFMKLMAGESDRTAKFVAGIGFFDGEKDHIFIDEEVGIIFEEKRGDDLRGWTEILYIYGDHYYPDKTLAELTDEEWSSRQDQRAKIDALVRLEKAVKNCVGN